MASEAIFVHPQSWRARNAILPPVNGGLFSHTSRKADSFFSVLCELFQSVESYMAHE